MIISIPPSTYHLPIIYKNNCIKYWFLVIKATLLYLFAPLLDSQDFSCVGSCPSSLSTVWWFCEPLLGMCPYVLFVCHYMLFRTLSLALYLHIHKSKVKITKTGPSWLITLSWECVQQKSNHIKFHCFLELCHPIQTLEKPLLIYPPPTWAIL